VADGWADLAGDAVSAKVGVHPMQLSRIAKESRMDKGLCAFIGMTSFVWFERFFHL